ncbi:MAG: hypothetical protein U0Q55_07895 [Vicinamibacterales bacterium]
MTAPRSVRRPDPVESMSMTAVLLKGLVQLVMLPAFAVAVTMVTTNHASDAQLLSVARTSALISLIDTARTIRRWRG